MDEADYEQAGIVVGVLERLAELLGERQRTRPGLIVDRQRAPDHHGEAVELVEVEPGRRRWLGQRRGHLRDFGVGRGRCRRVAHAQVRALGRDRSPVAVAGDTREEIMEPGPVGAMRGRGGVEQLVGLERAEVGLELRLARSRERAQRGAHAVLVVRLRGRAAVERLEAVGEAGALARRVLVEQPVVDVALLRGQAGGAAVPHRIAQLGQVTAEEAPEVGEQQPALRLVLQVALAQLLLLTWRRRLIVRIGRKVGGGLDRRLHQRLPRLDEVHPQLGQPRQLAVRPGRCGHRTERGDLAGDERDRRGLVDRRGEELLALADRHQRPPHGPAQSVAVGVRQREHPAALLARSEAGRIVARQPPPVGALGVLHVSMFDRLAAGSDRQQAADHVAELLMGALGLAVGHARQGAGKRRGCDVESLVRRLVELEDPVGRGCRRCHGRGLEAGRQARLLQRRGQRHAVDEVGGSLLALRGAPGLRARDISADAPRVVREHGHQAVHEIVAGEAQDRRCEPPLARGAPQRARGRPRDRMLQRAHQIFPAPGV
nr:hypothetical protein WG33_0047 [uncultured bacterium]